MEMDLDIPGELPDMEDIEEKLNEPIEGESIDEDKVIEDESEEESQ